MQTIAASVGGSTTRINVDMTNASLSNNRPWFSVVDNEHRSRLGTGAVSSANVHGLSINDLSVAGSLTFLQVALDHGMVVAKDQGIAGVPGTLCVETVSASSVLTDDALGTVTGIANALYFSVSRVPRLIHRVELPVAATGTITVGAAGTFLENETFTLYDGVNPAVVYQIDTDASVVETSTLRRIALTGSEITSEVRNIVLTAIVNTPALLITATAGGLF